MLFRQHILEGIADGRVTLAFRRWRKAPPAEGSTLRTAVGVLTFTRVTTIDEGDITDDDLQRCGMSAPELQRSLAGEGTLLRIELRLTGPDPRIALRDARPREGEFADVAARLARFDRASDAAWTARYLQLIDDRPAVVSRELAEEVGADLPAFKRRVRRLKDLGLTESLDIGYRLSPRGRLVLDHLEQRPPRRDTPGD